MTGYKRLEASAGSRITAALRQLAEQAPAEVEFNGLTIRSEAGDTYEDVCQRYSDLLAVQEVHES